MYLVEKNEKFKELSTIINKYLQKQKNINENEISKFGNILVKYRQKMEKNRELSTNINKYLLKTEKY